MKKSRLLLSLLFFTFIIVFLIGLKNNCEGQELEVFITTDKNFYERSDTIYVTYWIENTKDDTILFFEKSNLTVSTHCFEIYGANEELRRKDYGNFVKEDFITIEPKETIVRTYPYMVYWLCRNAPPLEDWLLEISYSVKRDESEKFYYKVNNEENREKVFIDAWTGTLGSNIDKIIILRKNY